jgi:hypothetical protein
VQKGVADLSIKERVDLSDLQSGLMKSCVYEEFYLLMIMDLCIVI